LYRDYASLRLIITLRTYAARNRTQDDAYAVVGAV
jgi:hypothetical protein